MDKHRAIWRSVNALAIEPDLTTVYAGGRRLKSTDGAEPGPVNRGLTSQLAALALTPTRPPSTRGRLVFQKHGRGGAGRWEHGASFQACPRSRDPDQPSTPGRGRVFKTTDGGGGWGR
jgi:hypothetical protein